MPRAVILTPPAIIAGFLASIRLVLGLALLVLAPRALPRGPGADPREQAESAMTAVDLLTPALVILTVLSWPLFYLLLQSYVPEWPEVMCIYGVTRIGLGSRGPAGFLPGIVGALEVVRPLALFLMGAGAILRAVDRRTAAGAYRGRALRALSLVGLVAALDAGLEVTYITIPKREDPPPAGCCTGAGNSVDRGPLPGVTSTTGRMWLSRFHFGLGLLASLAGLGLGRGWTGRPVSRAGLRLLCVIGLLSLWMAARFLREVLAPAALGLPYHPCVYDLVTRAPESVIAVILHITGVFAIGWAVLVRELAPGEGVGRSPTFRGGRAGRRSAPVVRALLLRSAVAISGGLLVVAQMLRYSP